MNISDYKKAMAFSNNFIEYFLNSKTRDFITKSRHAAIGAGLLILFFYHQENKKLTPYEEKIDMEYKLELQYFFSKLSLSCQDTTLFGAKCKKY